MAGTIAEVELKGGAVRETKLPIVVAEDNAEVLSVLVSALSEEFDVIATATDGSTALNHVERLQPAVVVLDLEMPALSGIEVTRQIILRALASALVICSVECDRDLIFAAQRAGALGYVIKWRLNRDLVTAVKRAACGRPFVSPSRSGA